MDELNQLASTGNKARLQHILSVLPSSVTAKKIKDQRLATPLHYAALNGHVDLCEVLIGRFGHEILYMKDCNQRTPLHCALHAKRLNVICYLLHLSPDLEGHDNLGLSCARMLHGLSARDTCVLLTRLEPEVLDPQLVLHMAIFALMKRDVKQALRYCSFAPVVHAPFYRPPLHLAAELGNEDIIKALLSDEKVRRAPYRKSITALSSLITPSEDDPVEPKHSVDSELRMPSMSEAETSLLETQCGEQQDRSAETAPTVESCENEQPAKKRPIQKKRLVKPREPDIVSELDVLLEEMVNTRHSPATRDSDGHLPFHYACQHGHHDVLRLLYFSDMSLADFRKGVRLALNWKR